MSKSKTETSMIAAVVASFGTARRQVEDVARETGFNEAQVRAAMGRVRKMGGRVTRVGPCTFTVRLPRARGARA